MHKSIRDAMKRNEEQRTKREQERLERNERIAQEARTKAERDRSA